MQAMSGLTDTLMALLATDGTRTPAAYVGVAVAFIIGGLLPVPRTAMVLATGFFMGMYAVPVIVASTTIGGMIAFVIARFLLQSPVHRLLARQRHLSAALRAVELEGWRVVALMRFYGPIPTVVQNYGFGLTDIGWRSFAAATLIFTVPQTVVYSYLGSLGKHVVLGRTSSPIFYIGAGLAVSCFALAAYLVGRRLRSLLEAREQDLVGARAN